MGHSFFKKYFVKPGTRYAYRKGKEFTKYYIRLYFRKYLLKYIRKRNKMRLGFKFDEDTIEMLGDSAVNALVEKKVETEDDFVALLRETSQMGVLDIQRSQGRVTGCGYGCCEKVNYEERFVYQEENDSDYESDDDEETEHQETNDESLRDIALYAIGLYKKASSNKGLDHGKTKEYWLERGPRQAITMVVYAAFSFFINESLGAPKPAERLKMIIVAGVAMLIAAFMLYYRLPDSINSAVLRSCHDWYVMNKKKRLPKLLKKQLGEVVSELEGKI